MKPIVEIKNLSYCQGSRYILKNINWTVYPSEHWVVFGQNGCGKTTLLSIVAGVNKYTSGNLEVFSQTYSNDNFLSLRSQIGLVSSSFFNRLYRYEKVSDIILSGKTGRFSVNEKIDICDVKSLKELAKKFDIYEKLSLPYQMLSKGEQQKVLLLRALINESQLLILDEPCDGLDIVSREYILKIIEHMALQYNKTIIYVTHYPEEILVPFQNCLLLKNGEIYASGKTKEVFEQNVLSGLLDTDIILNKADNHYSITCSFKGGE